MYIDLSTIYAFMFASLAVSGALTFWERRFHPLRKDVLAEWALAYAAFTLGCALLIFAIIPTPYQRAPAFLLNLFGYVALLDGVLRLNGGLCRSACAGPACPLQASASRCSPI